MVVLRKIFAIALFIVLFFILWISPLSLKLDRAINDSIFSMRMEKRESNITIIEIDADSLEKYNVWPWPRSLYAKALDSINKVTTGPIFIDIDFSSYSTPEEDQKLISSIRDLSQSRVVALPSFLQTRNTSTRKKILRSPLPELQHHAKQVSVNVYPDLDGFIRHIPQGFEWNNQFYPTAGTFIANPSNQTSNKLSSIDFSIDTQSFSRISISSLIDGTASLHELKNKTLLIGATAIELGDQLTTPLHPTISGVEIQALIASSKESGELVSINPMYNFIVVGILCLIVATLIIQHQWLYSLFCFIATITLLVGLTIIGHQIKYMLAIGAGVISLAITYFVITLWQLNQTLITRARLKVGLAATKTQLFTITEASSDLIISTNDSGKIIAINSRAEKHIEYDRARSRSGEIERYIPILQSTPVSSLTQATTETSLNTASSKKIPVELSVCTQQVSGKTTHTFIIRDISERKRREARLRYEANHDVLTGLTNRNTLEKRIATDLKKTPSGTLVSLGLDHFREANENFGVDTGDSILIAVGLRLLNSAGPKGVCSRLSGDNFGIWYPDLVNNPLTTERIKNIIYQQQRPYLIEGNDIEVAASLGIATIDSKDLDFRSLIANANAALYEAQHKKTSYEMYDEAKNQGQKSFINMISALRQAINKNELEPYFQPKIDLQTNLIVGSEVLARWPQQDGGFISPDCFIHTAENSRLIAPLTYHFLRQLINEEALWREEKIHQKLAINLSARLLGDEDFINDLCSYTKRESAYFEFELEVTESAVIHGKEKALSSIQSLREHGYRIAIDDYGTGYSSLAYLHDINPHTIKIDRSFVTDIYSSKSKQAIARSTIYMAQEMGMEVVAEGIETVQDQTFLQQLGCDIGQGYFYSKPLPRDAFFQFCRRWNQANTDKEHVG